jgi:F-type H+-transporting ATPase subunit b
VERLRTESQVEMQQEGERIRQETAHQMERLQQQATQDLDAAGKNARRELKAYAATLALQLAEQRVRARLNTDTESALVDGFVRDLQKQESQN